MLKNQHAYHNHNQHAFIAIKSRRHTTRNTYIRVNLYDDVMQCIMQNITPNTTKQHFDTLSTFNPDLNTTKVTTTTHR